MKFKLNRVTATGLIAAMLTSTTACTIEDIDRIIPHLVNTTTTQTIPTPSTEFKGPIWDELSQRGIMTHTKLPFDYSQLDGYAIPINFLKEKGLIIEGALGKLLLATERQATDMYRPFSSRAFVDNNSNENAIYLLFQFANGPIIPNETNENIYLMTWLLKYNVTEQDYQAFLNLDGDFRIRFFIQVMDELYEPEIVSESIVTPSIQNMGTYEKLGSSKNVFPYIFVSKVDYDRHIITFGAYDNGQLKYIDLDIRKTNRWAALLNQGYTKEELNDLIGMKAIQTPFGQCLNEFRLNNLGVGYTEDKAKETFANTDNVMDVYDIAINGTEAKYDLDDELNLGNSY